MTALVLSGVVTGPRRWLYESRITWARWLSTGSSTSAAGGHTAESAGNISLSSPLPAALWAEPGC